jgi:neutral amino acid transport system permease protein
VRRFVAVLIASLTGPLLVMTGAATTTPAWAAQAEEPAQVVQGQLLSPQEAADGGTENVPVEGAEIAVASAEGEEIGTATTDAEGRWVVPIPEPGTYEVSLSVDTLPEGVTLRDPERQTLTVDVASGQQRFAVFALGEGSRNVASTFDRVAQLTFEGLSLGLIIAMAAVGLSLIFGTTGLVNFAHGELVTLGALVAYFVNVGLGVPLIPAAIIAVAVCAALGGLLDLGFWGKLRGRGTGLIAMLVVSIGLSILLRYSYLYIFGGAARAYSDFRATTPLSIGGVNVQPKDIAVMVLTVVVLVGVALALTRTKIGKATRAVADNPALAASSGIDVERVIRVVWIAGAGLAALAGIMLGATQSAISWDTGFRILLLIFAAVVLGGLGTAYGALLGAVIIGLFTQLSTLVVPTELKNVGALAILILILLVRPQGLLGRAERVG